MGSKVAVREQGSKLSRSYVLHLVVRCCCFATAQGERAEGLGPGVRWPSAKAEVAGLQHEAVLLIASRDAVSLQLHDGWPEEDETKKRQTR